MVDQSTQSNVSKAVGLLVAAGATWAGRKVVGILWSRITGHTPPKPEDEGDARMSEVAITAALTAAVAGLARVFATRLTARFLS